jgi:TonB family protein
MQRIDVAISLFAVMLLPSAALALDATHGTTSTQVSGISTGVIAPKIVNDGQLARRINTLTQTFPTVDEVLLTLQVDEKGQAKNVQIVKSVNPYLDAHVVEAVRQAHFQPATLNNRAISIDMDLTISLHP